jgi:Ca2+-binding EF-hand superfamily protein
MFQTFESRLPSRGALVNGVILSLVSFALVSLAVERGRAHFPQLLIGAKYPRPQVLAVDRTSIEEAEPTTEIKIKAPAVDPSYPLADLYFKAVRVLDVLDADRDRTISAWEIVTSASPLRRLDRNGDGELSAEECGFSLGDNAKLRLGSEMVERARLEFMRTNPVLAALDVNGDGEISDDEIQNGSAVLRTLDQNHDGSLTASELLPDAAVRRSAMVLQRLDTNGDGELSPQEWRTDEAAGLRELFERADRNGDGLITASELTRQMRFQYELKRQTDMAARSIGVAAPRGDSLTLTGRK